MGGNGRPAAADRETRPMAAAAPRGGMTLAPDGLPPLRAVIAAYGLSAKKALGQNFLMDLNLTAKIARRAGSLADHDVLEVGPGPGGLTRALLMAGARHVVAIERDARALPALAEIAAAYPGRLTVLEGDALAIDPAPRLTPPVRVVANLPYNVGTELFVRWLTPPVWPPFWSSLTLMFQKEVAERIVAGPGSRAYGRLAILAQWRADARLAFEIPARAFTPPPKVDSAVVQLEALPEPRYPADPAVLARVVALAFGQRRKMLRASLKQLGPDVEELLGKAGIRPTDRAEQVPLEAFCRLSRLVAAR
jgi:16S rRNA (adenine1518-N6/adenine1519-N6)-dimethyltransferase